MQKQAFTHSPDIEGERDFNVKKFIDDGDSISIANEKADAMMLTAMETYETIGNTPIYFEWKFGANGRMYPTGYDIHLHGNKPKKGALRPVLW